MTPSRILKSFFLFHSSGWHTRLLHLSDTAKVGIKVYFDAYWAVLAGNTCSIW